MGMTATFEAVLAALLARDHEYPSDLEQKNMVRAEFLRGAATAFALCWRGEESAQCLEAAKGCMINSSRLTEAVALLADEFARVLGVTDFS
jgi:hypothetical protein